MAQSLSPDERGSSTAEEDVGIVGWHEGPGAPDKRRMPLMRMPGARIAVLTRAEAIWQTMKCLCEHEWTTVARYAAVADLMQEGRPDIVLVDRTMLGEGALAVRRIRQRWLTCTVIITGAIGERDAADLLGAGADDALSLGDPLTAPRLRAAARRARAINASTRTAIGDIIYDRESRRVWCARQEIRLTRTEEALLDCLFWYAPRPASVAELTAFAWGAKALRDHRNLVHVYVRHLRNKLSNSEQVIIRTRRNVGYEFAERPVARQTTSRGCSARVQRSR